MILDSQLSHQQQYNRNNASLDQQTSRDLVVDQSVDSTIDFCTALQCIVKRNDNARFVSSSLLKPNAAHRLLQAMPLEASPLQSCCDTG